jgi:hypothetical protein
MTISEYIFIDNCNQLIFYGPIHSLSMWQDTGNSYGGESIKKNLFVLFYCLNICYFWFCCSPCCKKVWKTVVWSKVGQMPTCEPDASCENRINSIKSPSLYVTAFCARQTITDYTLQNKQHISHCSDLMSNKMSAD